MKVLIVSGFLGAGKTTFIKELSSRTKEKFVILENEYGAVGLDGDILKKSGLNIWEMTSGCICCSRKGDFAASVLTISNSLDPDYLIIEPTGVGMLSNVINCVKKVEYDRIAILAPVTIIDGQSIDRYQREFNDIYLDQVKFANKIIVSKMQNTSIDERNRVISNIKEINPDATIICDTYEDLSTDFYEEVLSTSYTGEIIEKPKEENMSTFDSISFTNVTMRNESDLILLMEDIIHFKYGNIIRAKGSLKINNTGFSFDLVDNKYSILSFDDIESSNMVFIGQEIDKDLLKKKFIDKGKFQIKSNKVNIKNTSFVN